MGDINMSDYNAFLAEGGNYEQSGMYEKAITCYTKSIEAISVGGIMQDPIGRNCLCSRSRCYLQLGNHNAALADAEAALKDDVTFVKGIYAKAEALYFKGDFEFALVFYHRGAAIRPENADFRLGIQKAREAIDNAIGSTERCQLTTKGDLTLFYKGMEALKAGQRPRRGGTGRRSAKLGAASTSTVKQLLGELYADKQFLEELMADPSLVMGQGEEIRSLAASGAAYLDKRTEFWRQQKPIYARVNESKAKEMKKTVRSTMQRTAGSATKGKDSKVTQQLEEIEQMLESGDADAALSSAQQLLKSVEESTMSDKQRVLASVHGAIGNAHLDLDHLDAALASHKKELEIAQKHNLGDSAVGRALGNVGRSHARLGDYTKALDAWLQKVPLCSDATESAWLYHEIGRCYMEQESFSSALEYGQKSNACAVEAGDDRWKLNSSVLIAQAQASLGDYSEAAATFNSADVIAEQLGDSSAQDAIATALADVRAKMVISSTEDGEN